MRQEEEEDHEGRGPALWSRGVAVGTEAYPPTWLGLVPYVGPETTLAQSEEAD